MGRITGGRVSFKETRQVAQYEPRVAEWEFAFACDEGEDVDTIADELEKQVIGRVHRMLGLQTAAVLHPLAAAKEPEAKEPETAEVVEEPKRKPGRPVKPKVVKEPDPEDDDNLDDVMGAVTKPAAEITDDDLIKKVARHPCAVPAKEGGDPKSLKALINKHGGARVAEIPQPNRAAFLKELAELKAPEKLAA